MCDDQWQKIETAPKDGTEILVWIDDVRKHCQVRWVTDGWMICWDGKYLVHDPTHWQPLPSPPKANP